MKKTIRIIKEICMGVGLLCVILALITGKMHVIFIGILYIILSFIFVIWEDDDPKKN